MKNLKLTPYQLKLLIELLRSEANNVSDVDNDVICDILEKAEKLVKSKSV